MKSFLLFKRLIFIGLIMLFCSGWVKGQTYWKGTAGDGLWSTATNWVGDALPISASDVVLDNTNVSGSYTVTIDASASTITVKSLQIGYSGNVNTITLIVSTATLNILTVSGGGATALHITDGGILSNQSTSPTRGIMLDKSTDVFKMSGSGKYIHNSSSAIPQRTSGTISANYDFASTSVFEFQTWEQDLTPSYGTFNYNVNATKSIGTGTNILVINGDLIVMSGIFGAGAGGTNTLNIAGNVSIESGAEFRGSSGAGTQTINIIGNITGSGTMSGSTSATGATTNINIGGSITTLIGFSNQTNNIRFTGGSPSVNFIPANSNPNVRGFTVTSGKTVTIGATITIPSTYIVTIDNGGNLALGIGYTNNGTLNVNGILDCSTYVISGSGSFNLASGATYKTAIATGINGSITVSGTKTLSTAANYTFNGSTSQVTGALLPTTVNNLTVDNAAGVTFESNKQLTVSGTLTNTAGSSIVVQSDASNSGSLIISGTYSGAGTFTYQRYIPDANFHMLGSPIEDQTINSFLTNVDNSIELNAGNYSMKHYVESPEAWSSLYTSATSGNIVLGQGYATKRSASGTVNLTGTPNNANVEVTLTKGELGYGWNLLSNPFTSAIAANNEGGVANLIANNTAVLHDSYEALYIWNGSAYVIINHFGGTPEVTLSQNYLQAGQGFFVKSVNPAIATKFQMTTAMQSHQTGIAFKSDEIPWTSIVLNVEKNNTKISTQIAYKETMSRGLDVGYDAGIMKSSSFALYSRLVEDNGIDFGIQCLPTDYSELVVPIGLNAKAGDIVKFTAQSINLPEEYFVVLEDRTLSVFTNLSDENAEYSVQLASDSKDAGRFYIRTSIESALNIDDLELDNLFRVFTRPNNNQIVIRGEANANTIAHIYSITGKQVAIVNLKQSSENLVQFNEEAGIYIVKISNEQGTFTQKFAWLK